MIVLIGVLLPGQTSRADFPVSNLKLQIQEHKVCKCYNANKHVELVK